MRSKWTVFFAQELISRSPVKTAALPIEAATILDIRKGQPEKTTGYMSRRIAFVAHGQRVLQVISYRRSPKLFMEVMSGRRGVATATVVTTGTYKIPQAVLRHLGYTPQPGRNTVPVVSMAWSMPAKEYACFEQGVYREIPEKEWTVTDPNWKQVAKRAKTPPGEYHLYLSRAEFVDLHRSKSPAPESLL
jgi:hypothetical protein